MDARILNSEDVVTISNKATQVRSINMQSFFFLNFKIAFSYLCFKIPQKHIKHNKKRHTRSAVDSRYLWYKAFRLVFFSGSFLLLSSDPDNSIWKVFFKMPRFGTLSLRGAERSDAVLQTGEMSCGLDAARLGADLSHFNLIFRNHTH